METGTCSDVSKWKVQMKVIILVSLVDRDSTSWVASDGDWDLQRVEGGPLAADEGDGAGILSRPRLDIVGSVRWRLGPVSL